MSTTEQAYIPGVCNINRAEIAYRRKAGFVGLGITLVLLAAIVALGLNRWFRVVLFLPAFVAAIGFLQARNKFCVAYGANGRQNASEDSDEAHAVTDTAATDKDKSKARKMNIQAAILAMIFTLFSLLIPMPH